MRLGLRFFSVAGAIASLAIILMTIRTICSTSVHVTGSSRLPMVAGWDRLLPAWFARLHPKYRTPVNSIIFIATLTVVIAVSSQIGAGIQEAFQLVDNASNIFYGIVYFILFAVPLAGAAAVRSDASIWLRIAAGGGAFVSVLAIIFAVIPIIDVPNSLVFGLKIGATALVANAIGVAAFVVGGKKRRA